MSDPSNTGKDKKVVEVPQSGHADQKAVPSGDVGQTNRGGQSSQNDQAEREKKHAELAQSGEKTAPSEVGHTGTADRDDSKDAKHVEIPQPGQAGQKAVPSGGLGQKRETDQTGKTAQSNQDNSDKKHVDIPQSGQSNQKAVPSGDVGQTNEGNQSSHGDQAEREKKHADLAQSGEKAAPSDVGHTGRADRDDSKDPKHVEIPQSGHAGQKAVPSGDVGQKRETGQSSQNDQQNGKSGKTDDTDYSSKELKPIPQPKETLLLGNLLDVDLNDKMGSLCRLAALYGEIYQLKLKEYVVFVSSQRLVHYLCNEQKFHKYISQPLKEVRAFAGDGLFTSYSNEHNWELAHRILVPAFSPVAIRKMQPLMCDIITQMLMFWEHHAGEPFEAADQYTRLTFVSHLASVSAAMIIR